MSFNPPSPCGEGRVIFVVIIYFCVKFQSTLPVWGGTREHALQLVRQESFNPPSPCGEGRINRPWNIGDTSFNPPSPCGEGP